MLNDEDLVRTLRSALPPVAMTAPAAPQPRSHDLWPSVVARARQRPRWSVADWSVAAMVVVALLMFPKWILFLAYHL